MIKAVNVKRVFGKGSGAVTALQSIDLEIPSSALVALKGRSGSGKTTLLNILGALDQPTEGEVWFQGQEISSWSERRRSALRRSHFGLVFQQFGLIPLMSAYENVEFGLRIAGVPAKLSQEKAESALEWVGMKARMKHRPGELSGGEQQRVAIARAIAHDPVLLLADEPTAELDSTMGMQVMSVFRRLTKQLGMTVVLTTHDPDIMGVADYVLALEDGHIVEQANG